MRILFFFVFILFSCSNLKENNEYKYEIDSINIITPPYNLLQKNISFKTTSEISAFVSYWIKNSNSVKYSESSKKDSIHNFSLIFLKPQQEYQYLIHDSNEKSLAISDTLSFFTDKLPEYIPNFTLEKNDFEFDGLIFLRTPSKPGVQLLIDNRGRVVWFQKSDDNLPRFYDFLPPNSYLSSYEPNIFYKINFYGDTIYKIDTKDKTLHHELTKDKNNNIIGLSYAYKQFDLRPYGGRPRDAIKGDGIVVYDTLGNLIWEWDIFDHEDPIPYLEDNRMTLTLRDRRKLDTLKKRSKGIFNRDDIQMTRDDWSHGNAIGITQDNNYIISFRNFHQLWKIDSQSGKVLWKLGLNGNVKIDSDNYFYAQHAIHHIKGDTLLLFDNGHRDYRVSSRALMFRMIDGEFSLIKSIFLPKELYTFKQGSVYLIENDKLLFSCSVKKKLVITNLEGKILWQLAGEHSFYRANYIDNIK